MNKFYIFPVYILLFLSIGFQLHAQQVAFPGAEGAGKFTSGGRGTISVPTTVFEVTSLLDDNSAGTLRYACTQSTATYPYRTIVFRISGTIHLNSKLSIPRNTTIAGQTAPGDGICLADFPVSINGDNVIIRYIRIRMGDKNQLKTSPVNCGLPVAPFTDACKPIDGSGGDDALGDLGHKNIIIDHCSISWSSDEALTLYRGDSLTLQWNFISEPLNYSYHFETGDTDFENHGYGGIWGARHGSFHHNLIAHCRNRTPRFGGNSTYPAGTIESADFRNNVIYNWGINNIYGGEGGQYNLVNNYYKYGPSTSNGVKYRVVGVDSSLDFGYASYYLAGNYIDGSTTNTNNNWSGALMKSGIAADTVRSKVNTPFLPAYLPLVTETALAAYDTVLKSAGCSLPNRDTLDERIVKDVKNRTGKIIDVQGGFLHGTAYAQTVNAWPNLASTLPPADTDHDGMPDDWEIANSLNAGNAADRGLIAVNGYTNLENYLNSIKSNPPEIVEPVTSNAAANWPLTTDQSATVEGNITASSQVLGSQISGTQYGSTFGTVPAWQRTGTISFLPIGYNENTYVEYKMAPSGSKSFKATSMEFAALGGGTGTAKMAIYYSLDNFVTSFPLGSCTYNGSTFDATVASPVSLLNTSTTPLTGQQIVAVPTSIVVAPAQTFSVRVYVWITGSGNRYFASQQVKINGLSLDEVLPLSLVNFSASKQSGKTTLVWQTKNATNMKAFEVERSSDGRVFHNIGNVPALDIAKTYFFTDKDSFEGMVYYRLKMVNKDGSFTYSYVVTINSALAKALLVYPNPVTSTITVTHHAAPAHASISIFSIEGKLLLTMPVASNSTQTSFTTGILPKGNLLLRYSDVENTRTIKFLKQ